MLVRTIDTDVLFKGLVSAFSLSIGFQVITRSEVKLHIKGLCKGVSELGDKFRAAVRSDVVGNTVFGKHMGKE